MISGCALSYEAHNREKRFCLIHSWKNQFDYVDQSDKGYKPLCTSWHIPFVYLPSVDKLDTPQVDMVQIELVLRMCFFTEIIITITRAHIHIHMHAHINICSYLHVCMYICIYCT